jgi:hypothetical protein
MLLLAAAPMLMENCTRALFRGQNANTTYGPNEKDRPMAALVGTGAPCDGVPTLIWAIKCGLMDQILNYECLTELESQ